MNEGASLAELARYRLWSMLLRGRCLDAAAAAVPWTEEEADLAWDGFCKARGLDAAGGVSVPTEYAGLDAEGLRAAVAADGRITKWKRATFGPAAEERFLRKKAGMDRIVFSMVRVKDADAARELFIRIREGESTFAELVGEFGSENEKLTAGRMGPVAMASLHPDLSKRLATAPEGGLLDPFGILGWYVVARVEKKLPATFDETMRNQMIDELTQEWLEGEVAGGG